MMSRILIVLSVVIFACNEIRECDLNPNTELVGISFKNYPEKTDKTSYFKSIYSSNYTVKSGRDTLQYKGFPLDPTTNKITYYFETDTLGTFDLTLHYRINKVHLYSLDCGASFAYDSLYAESLGFDSIAIISHTVQKNFPVNVEIYF
jgi:hypothetical protein